MKKTVKLLPQVLVPSANPAPSLFAHFSGVAIQARPPCLSGATPGLFASHSSCSHRDAPPECKSRNPSQVMIYVVDDEEELTELYALLLKRNGYRVRAFNDRAEALKSLIEDKLRPDLLVSDYLGGSMPVDRFMQCCRLAHPGLRILMASGFFEINVQFAGAKPDRFIQKPFTPEEFLREVSAALTAR